MTSTTLYQEMLMEHGRFPRHTGRCAHETSHHTLENPLCGDRCEVSVAEKGGIYTVCANAHGCLLSKASASIMGEIVQGVSKIEIEQKLKDACIFLKDGSLPPTEKRLLAFSGVFQHPSRIKCALLPWHTLAKALGLQLSLEDTVLVEVDHDHHTS